MQCNRDKTKHQIGQFLVQPFEPDGLIMFFRSHAFIPFHRRI